MRQPQQKGDRHAQTDDGNGQHPYNFFGITHEIVQKNETVGFANTMTAKVPADSHMSARITTSFEQENAQGGLSNVMHNCSGGMDDDAASLK